ncbi:MAG: shikimate dehydrogenase [Clostridia bacterium]|nr:shikimate dehydrogenase [Clostridia bacterium]
MNFAVIGHPIGHTMSPYIHNRLFELSGKTVTYYKYDINPDNLAEQYDKILKKLDGFNVTIPHKQAIIPLLKGLDESAFFYGAVNCVDKNGIGYNTDAFGFCTAINKKGISLEGKVLLLGSGGAARTIAFEAIKAGCELTVAARGISGLTLKNEIAEKLGKQIKVIPFNEVCGGYDLVVNATPVGMYPNTDVSPLSDGQLCGCKALFDAIYNPRKTLLMKFAEDCNMKIAEGMAMLVWQAVRAHEIWYGAKFDDKDIDRLIDDANNEMAVLFGGQKNE